MDEYPNEEDEFEMMHQMELEMMREMDENDIPEDDIPYSAVPPSIRRSLDFTNLSQKSDSHNLSQKTVSINNNDNSLTDISAGKKRSLDAFNFDDSFNDDIPYEGLDLHKNNGGQPKRLKLPDVGVFKDPTLDLEQHEKDQETIKKIVYERSKRSANEFLETIVEENCNQSKNIVTKRILNNAKIHKRIPDGGFQAMTSYNGNRFYLDLIDEDIWDSSVDNVIAKNSSNRLLAVPFNVMIQKAEREMERLVMKASAAAAKQQGIETSPEPMEESEDSGVEEDAGDNLWVQKYRPKFYLDLLSDESTNRLVLHWIKLWDKVVFGRAPKVKSNEQLKKEADKEKFNKYKFKSGPELIEELDEHGRPAQKVVLLCGAPGLGKTTLAHIIAKHAGYNIVEMNASDDRSIEAFRTTIENATSMKSVLGKDKKPNCLIIDEIDGAPAATINFLVNYLNGKNTGKGKKKKDDSSKLLQRPVLCICNDLYTPALRPLRQMALTIQFPPTLACRLATRLLEICRRQRMRVDYTVLTALCDKTENDIRSCLSVLQFLRSTKKEVRLDDIDSAAVGMKDYQRSLFSVWYDIFTIPRQKKRRRVNPHELKADDRGILLPMPDLDDPDACDSSLNTLSGRFSKMLKTTQSCGEYDKLTLGWFENYLSLKFKHKALEPVTGGLEWAIFTDVVQREINHGQTWILMGYLPFACVSYHLLFAMNRSPNKLQFPMQFSDSLTKITKSKNLLATLVSDMTGPTRMFASTTSLIQDILPFLLQIIQPSLRPVNTHLYSAKEKEELFNLVNTMIGYNLTYTQEKTIDGQYSYNLDPNVEEIVRFQSLVPAKQLSYTSRQLVAREIELEKLRRSENQFSKDDTVSKEKMEDAKQSNAKSVPNHLQKLKPIIQMENKNKESNKTAIAEPKVNLPRDFFGRVIELRASQVKTNVVNDIVKSDVWFKFKEGYSNAVRRPVKMIDLIN